MASRSMLSNPFVQSALMGCAFLLTFCAYDTIQVFAKRLYPANVGPNMSFFIYVAFTLSAFVAPAAVNAIGPRLSMTIGIICYSSVVIAGLIFFLTGQAPWIVYLSGAVLGVGAGLLWTAQGKMILEISTDANRGKVFGLFWSLYRGASISGGLLSFTYFSVHPGSGSTPLYIIFLVLIFLGAISTGFLLDPSQVDRGGEQAMLTESRPSAPTKSVIRDVQDTFALFARPEMLLLSLMFYTSGGNEPFILSGFTDRWFDKRTTGIELVIYFSLSVVGSMTTGTILDRYASRGRVRDGALLVLGGFTLLHFLGFAGAAVVEISDHWDRRYGIDEPEVLLPSLAFCCWGLSDAMINSFLYWLVGQLYVDGGQRAQAIGFFKMLNSFAHVVGYAILPTDRVSAVAQLWYNIVTYVVGVVGAYVVVSRLGTDRTFEKKVVRVS